jgi:hypothetical protein
MYGQCTDARSNTSTAVASISTMTASAVGGRQVGKVTGQGGHRNAGIKTGDTYEKNRKLPLDMQQGQSEEMLVIAQKQKQLEAVRLVPQGITGSKGTTIPTTNHAVRTTTKTVATKRS